MWKVFIFAVAFFLGSGLEAWPGTSDWMKNLDDNALITTLSIPGTHDSGADHEHCYQDTSCKDNHLMASTQTYPINVQMTMGIRFFDVRVADEGGGDLPIHHGPYYLSQHLSDVIDYAQSFLSENPSEFVFYLIDQEETSVSATDFWADITALLSTYPQNLFYLDRSIPTVGQVRGKIVIAARDCQTTYPQGYCIDWSNNSPYSQTKDGDLFYVAEDHYSLNYVADDQKLAEARQLLGLARICSGCQSNNTLYFTFLSGEGDAAAKWPDHYASYMNPAVADYLWNSALNGPRSGIIAMDYAGDSDYSGNTLIDHIIAQNKGISIPGSFGTSASGGGMTAADINGNGTPDLVVFDIDNQKGTDAGYYRIGWDVDQNGKASSWTDPYAVLLPNGFIPAGSGIAAADMNGDGTPDLILFMVNEIMQGSYCIGYMGSTGIVTNWSDFIEIMGGTAAAESMGGGIGVADINGNGTPDLAVLYMGFPPARAYYRIGWDVGQDSKASSWTDSISIPWQGTVQQEGGIKAADMNSDGTPDLIVFIVDNSSGINHGYYRIGYLEAPTGTVSQWTDFTPMLTWFSSVVQGAGIVVTEINGNGSPDFAVFNIDHSESAGNNYGYYRIIWDVPN